MSSPASPSREAAETIRRVVELLERRPPADADADADAEGAAEPFRGLPAEVAAYLRGYADGLAARRARSRTADERPAGR
jgi:hypothetical protein